MTQPLRAGIFTKDADRYLKKYLNPDVLKSYQFTLNSDILIQSGSKLKINDIVIQDDKYHAVITHLIPVSKLDKPAINSRIGYHPETHESSVLLRFNESLSAIAQGYDIPFILPEQGLVYASQLQKVKIYRAKADFVLSNHDGYGIFYISHKKSVSNFPSYGGVVANFRDSPVLSQFKQSLLNVISLEQGVQSGTFGMNLAPHDPLHESIIRSVLFGTAHAIPYHGPHNVNAIMHGELRLVETEKGFLIESEKEIVNGTSFAIEEHPLQLVAHRMAGRNDLGFKDTHVMVIPKGLRKVILV